MSSYIIQIFNNYFKNILILRLFCINKWNTIYLFFITVNLFSWKTKSWWFVFLILHCERSVWIWFAIKYSGSCETLKININNKKPREVFWNNFSKKLWVFLEAFWLLLFHFGCNIECVFRIIPLLWNVKDIFAIVFFDWSIFALILAYLSHD